MSFLIIAKHILATLPLQCLSSLLCGPDIIVSRIRKLTQVEQHKQLNTKMHQNLFRQIKLTALFPR